MPSVRQSHPIRLASAVLLLALGACERGADGPSPEAIAARRDATRRVCISTELLRKAEDQVETLQSAMGTDEGPAGELMRRTGLAALQYVRAYHQHAELRAAAYARADSARNYSRSMEDSARHARAADQFQIRTPEAGTLEANVLQAYQSDFATLLNDADHPCNWELEEG